jgi:hypothetical protein
MCISWACVWEDEIPHPRWTSPISTAAGGFPTAGSKVRAVDAVPL